VSAKPNRLRRALTACGAVAIGFACSRTEDPVEHFRTGSSAPTGGAQAQGGSSSVPVGGKAPGQAGKTGVGGGKTDGGDGATPVAMGGDDAVGGDGNVVGPPQSACGDAPISNEPFTRQALRAAAADCAAWQYCHFEEAAEALADDAAAYAAAPSTETLASAQQAFTRAFERWSRSELFQFGPLASKAESAGKDEYQGLGTRDLIYSWPLVARCRVEEQVANQNYLSGFDQVLVSGRGLFGLEYLLYYPGSDTVCAPASVAGKKWPTLSADDLSLRKQAYAAALADDVLERVGSVRQAWSADGENFRAKFVDASGYPSEQEAMKVMAWALLYMEREVKDWKLGWPAGYTATAPVSVGEASFSGRGSEAIRANLRGFRALFQGCGADGEGLGFDDWLSEAGHGELATDIVTAWRTAQATADAHPRAAEATPAELDALYLAVKALTDLLKNDLFGAGSPLGLALPKGLEGDTD
jgi:predicted lipoprotein